MQDELIDYKIGFRVEQLRKKFEYSRDVLSEKIGISSQHLGNIEKGRRRITLDLLTKIQAVFQVPFEYFIYGESNKNNLADLTAILNGMNKELYPHFEDMIISFIKALNTDREIRK